MQPRTVQPELLDKLPADDPRARRSRRDLRRVNAWMGNARHLTAMLKSLPLRDSPPVVTEIGGGDGTLMLEVARRLQRSSAAPDGKGKPSTNSGPNWAIVDGTVEPTGQPCFTGWTRVALHVLDRQRLISPETIAQFAVLGWTVRAVQGDAFQWLSGQRGLDIVIANLFLHHFEDSRLNELFMLLAGSARALIACEPRRVAFPFWAGQLVWLIGCNAVTRHDAIASIRAGFTGQELSMLWSVRRGWELREARAGLFSHAFCAAARLIKEN